MAWNRSPVRHLSYILGGGAALLAVGVMIFQALLTPLTPWQDYLQRLERVLQIPLPDTEIWLLPLAPQRAEMGIPIDTPRLHISDIWAFRQCDFLYQVAKANSGLGRVMSDAARAVHERQLVQAMQRCVTALPESDAATLPMPVAHSTAALAIWFPPL